MWAARRRAIILSIILGLFFVLVVLPYGWSHREIPSCSDGKMNQNERGVDCSGPCIIACKDTVKDIKILWTKVLGVRKGAYDVVAYLENQNADVGIKKLSYSVKLYDANGSVAAERAGDTFVAPNERFAIFEGNMLTGDKNAVKGEVQILPNFNWIYAKKGERIFSLEDKLLVGVEDKPKLSATLRNNSPELLRDIDVTAVIYDAKAQTIGVSATKVEKLAARGSEKINFTWPTPFNYFAESEECETSVDAILVLDRSGSMSSDQKSPPQPLTDAKSAAADFVDYLGQQNQVGYVTFANEASKPMDQVLTKDAIRVKDVIDKTTIKTNGLQYTNIGDALLRAVDEFAGQRRNPDASPIIVLLTDGIPNRPIDPIDPKNKAYGADYGRKMAESAKKQGVSIYTIGLGSDIDSMYLTELASSPDNFFIAASGAELAGIYKRISTAVCKKGPSVLEIIPRVNNVTPAF